MSNVKHTSGPWAHDWYYGYMSFSSPAYPDGYFARIEFATATTAGCTNAAEQLANARLIAAAPELLAALKSLVSKYDKMADGDITGQLTNGDFLAAKDAIAKAEGRE